MAFFTQDFIDFFKELSTNNKKEWFDSNRKRYEKTVKQPFAKLKGKLLLDEKLADVFMEYYQVGKPVNEFFQRAF